VTLDVLSLPGHIEDVPGDREPLSTDFMRSPGPGVQPSPAAVEVARFRVVDDDMEVQSAIPPPDTRVDQGGMELAADATPTHLRSDVKRAEHRPASALLHQPEAAAVCTDKGDEHEPPSAGALVEPVLPVLMDLVGQTSSRVRGEKGLVRRQPRRRVQGGDGGKIRRPSRPQGHPFALGNR
jgi:hypothetical protein